MTTRCRCGRFMAHVGFSKRVCTSCGRVCYVGAIARTRKEYRALMCAARDAWRAGGQTVVDPIRGWK